MNNIIKFLLVCFAVIGYGQTFAAFEGAAASSGPLNYRQLNTTVVIPPEDLPSSPKLYLALLANNILYFYSPTSGFVEYSGGEPKPAKILTESRANVTIKAWDQTGVVGGDVFVGYGRDIMEMVESGRYMHLLRINDLPEKDDMSVEIKNALSGRYLCRITLVTSTSLFDQTATAQITFGTNAVIVVGSWVSGSYGIYDSSDYRDWRWWISDTSKKRKIIVDRSTLTVRFEEELTRDAKGVVIPYYFGSCTKQ